MRQENDHDLVRQIRSAFADLPIPVDEELVKYRGRSAPLTEETSVYRYLRGRHWTEIPLRVLNKLAIRGALIYLLPVGFRFYLPAYMIATIKSKDDLATYGEIYDHTEFALELENLRKSGKLAVFDRKQLEAISAFLRWMVQQYPDDKEAISRADMFETYLRGCP